MITLKKKRRVPFLLLLLSPLTSTPTNAEGNVTCSGTGMDWYTNQVGETPCKTYERLRQICNPNFEVGTMNTNTPPDVCDEQLADCCCNSIAFALAMLCLNCQQNIGSGSGYDAGTGAYQDYLQGSRTSGTCSPVKNQTLPTDIQTAVCNQKIKIFNDLYSLFWNDGSCQYTLQTLTRDIASEGNNTFTHCASTTVNGTSSSSSSSGSSSSTSSSSSSSGTSTSTSAADSTSTSSGLSGGAVGGIVAGVVIGAIGVGAIVWLFWWRRRQRDGEYDIRPEDKIEPFTGGPREAYGQPGETYDILIGRKLEF
ncbi:hypothetical protein GYMLUDRAFT_160655 [Collybiopsis luxurians FD-317 M1]|nr:hypothetical protein GYMLUDRAFT_160655 [Collybiopsis luxurians FD-317 M1]